MFDQFLDDCDMPRIQRGTGVVSPNHAGYTPYAAVDNIIVKGDIGSPECSAQMVIDGLVTESRYQIVSLVRDHNLLFPLRKIFNGFEPKNRIWLHFILTV